MADKKNDEIEIEDDVPLDQAVTVDLGAPEKGNGKDPAPADTGGETDGAESLREQLAAERNRRIEAERLAAENATKVRASEGSLQDSRVATIDNAIAAQQAAQKDLRSRLIAAKQSGDFETEADLDIEIAASATKLQRLTEGKNALESEIEARKNAPAVNDVENYVRTLANPRARAWVREHPEVVQDRAKTEALTQAHFDAIAEGYAEGSKAYFGYIEQEMGYADPAPVDPAPAARQERKQAAPAAPPSRGGSQSADRRDSQITLTPEQREAARISGISDVEYARNLQAIARQNATTH